jgi:hypothetical protein
MALKTVSNTGAHHNMLPGVARVPRVKLVDSGGLATVPVVPHGAQEIVENTGDFSRFLIQRLNIDPAYFVYGKRFGKFVNALHA